MAKAGYTLSVPGAGVALTATVTKTVLGVRAGSTFGLDLQEVSVSFDGVTAGNRPILIELVRCTFATNPPGTASTDTAAAIAQLYGLSIAHGCTAAHTWTTEPTVRTVIDGMRIHPQSGVIYQLPLGRTPDCVGSDGFIVRLTANEAVNANVTMIWERM